MGKYRRYNILTTDYWLKFRAGRREKGKQARYSRRKRNNDIRWAARNNIKNHGSLGRAVYRVKGHIRAARQVIEHDNFAQRKLMFDLGMIENLSLYV